MRQRNQVFFLGANSARGFSSLYDRWIDQSRAQGFYAVKGGPGCGKSTLMKGVAQAMEGAGYAVEYIRCSGDPDSLDGIAIPAKGAAMVDGTAPHRMDPAYPGVTGHYVDLGAGYDRKTLAGCREEIIRAANACRACYPQAYRRFQAAAESLKRGQSPLHTPEALEETKKRAASLLENEAGKSRPEQGKRNLRFLGGLTCRGKVLLEDTAAALCDHGYQIRDDIGLGDTLLRELESGFLERGWDVISCPDPLRPEHLAHLLVPDRGVAFLTGPLEKPDLTTIRTESLAEKTVLAEHKGFLRLSLRVADELIDEGLRFLTKAKQAHDRLEALYHPHVDFSLCETLIEILSKEILALPDV